MKLILVGEYWDSQIYSGELLLFDTEGAIHRIEWRDVVDAIAQQHSSVQTAIRVAFSDSDLFYYQKVRKILRDPEIETPIKAQLSSLAALTLEATRGRWQKHWRTEATPFDFLPTDTEVYYNQVIASGDEGLFSVARSSVSGSRLFGKRAYKHHDARILQVRASDRYTAVAAAAGDDGLIEFPFRRDEDDVFGDERQLAKRACSSCDWAFQSVLAWTADSAFMASFREEKDPRSRRVVRTFDRIIEPSEFSFNSAPNAKNGFTWGCREKIYRLSERGVEVATYTPQSRISSKKQAPSATPSFDLAGSISLDFDTTLAIATGTAPFGTVLEFQDRLVVVRSDGEVDQFLGEPVHWRVFPRSEHYSNQLHIIYEDRLEIVSFVHDYFVDQVSKLSGFKRGSNDFLSELSH